MTKRVQNLWSFFEIECPPFWTAFLPVSSIEGMPTAVLCRHCAHALHVVQGNKKCVWNRVETTWIMAEIEPYSFEPMRYSSQSEEDDVRESQDGRQRGNTSLCVCECCVNWEVQQENAYAARKSRKQLVNFQVNNTVVFSRRC